MADDELEGRVLVIGGQGDGAGGAVVGHSPAEKQGKHTVDYRSGTGAVTEGPGQLKSVRCKC
jgi:hypothetical protein